MNNLQHLNMKIFNFENAKQEKEKYSKVQQVDDQISQNIANTDYAVEEMTNKHPHTLKQTQTKLIP